MKRLAQFSTICVILLTLMSGVEHCCAAEDVLTHVPPNALGYLVINRLSDSSKKFEHVAKRLGIPTPSPVAFLEAAGVSDGLDLEGSVMFLALPKLPDDASGQNSDVDSDAEDEEEKAEPNPFSEVSLLALLPVQDYAIFLKQFGAPASKDGVTEISVAATPMLIAQRGSFAVLAEPDNEKLLREFLNLDPQERENLSPLSAWAGQQDIFAGSTQHSLQMLVQLGLKECERAKARIQRQAGNQEAKAAAANLKRVIAQLDKYVVALNLVGKEIPAGAIGFRLNESLDAFLSAQILVEPAGEFANWCVLPHSDERTLLAGLPAGPIVYATGFSVSQPSGEVLSELFRFFYSMGFASNRVLKESERLEKLQETVTEMFASVQSVSAQIEPGEGDDALYQNVLVLLRVEDSTKFIQQYAEFAEQISKLSTENGEKESAWKVAREELLGQPGLVVTYDSLAHYDNEFLDFLRKINTHIFGPEGKHTTYFSAADTHMVIVSCVSPERAEIVWQAAQNKTAQLATDDQIRSVAKLLPGRWDWQFFFSPPGAAQLVRRLRSMAQPFAAGAELEFPATRPAVFGARTTGRGLELQLVVPAETWENSYHYVSELNDLGPPE